VIYSKTLLERKKGRREGGREGGRVRMWNRRKEGIFLFLLNTW
jgi:hypothetical protein